MMLAYARAGAPAYTFEARVGSSFGTHTLALLYTFGASSKSSAISAPCASISRTTISKAFWISAWGNQ